MNLKKYITSFFVLTTFAFSYGQETKELRKKIRLEIGYNSGALKNLDLAPVSKYNYTGTTLSVDYIYTTKKQNSYEIELKNLNSVLKSEAIDKLNIAYETMRFNLTYLKKIYSNTSLKINLGPSFQSVFSSYEIDKETYLIEFQQQVGIAARVLYQFNNNQYISSKATIPLGILLLGNINNDLFGPKNYRGVSWSSMYGYTLSERFEVTLDYFFTYTHINIPSTYKEAQHQLAIGINYKF